MSKARPSEMSKSYPTDGGYKASDCEPHGSAGQKEPTPGGMSSMASDEGYHDTGPVSQHARSHGFPAVRATPENVTGSIETKDPTAAQP